MIASRAVALPATVSADRTTMDWRVWLPSVAMMLCSWLSYVDRQILAVLSPVILKETGLTAESYAEVVSVFSITYMLGNPVWASLLDFAGVRIGMLAAVALWSIASTSHAWMAGFLGFAVARGVLGLGEGATFPGSLQTAIDSLPQDRHARGIAISFSGSSLGAILAPLVVTPVALVFGWRGAFLFSGILGAVWLVLWWILARPPYLPDRERPVRSIIWPNPLERRFWALSSIYATGVLPLSPILYLSPLYLNRVLGFSQADLGKVLWIPPVGWAAGYYFWAWVADRRGVTARKSIGILALLAALALPLAFVTRTSNPAMVLFSFAWMLFVVGGFTIVSLRVGVSLYPDQPSQPAGIGIGAWSALVAVLMPLLGRWFDQHRYDQTFLLVALIPAVGVAFWSWLSRIPGSPARSFPA